MRKGTAIIGTRQNEEKFKRLQEERWERRGLTIFYCRKHNTFFVPAEEPCWQCYDECQEVIS